MAKTQEEREQELAELPTQDGAIVWVAKGPTEGTDWCHIPNAPTELLAPGRVVLCHAGTRKPHPDAARAAESSWQLISRWLGYAIRAD